MEHTLGSCINHGGVEAVARCKQCGKAVCSKCVVKGFTGSFCCDACKERHEKFVGKAEKLEQGRGGGGLKRLLKRFLFLVIIGGVVSFGLTMAGFNIPIISDIIINLMNP